MEAFLICLGTVAVAEVGDRTQLLSLLLAARFKRPWPVLAGVVCATVVNHGMAGIVGVWVGKYLRPSVLDIVVGVSMIVMALWTLKPDKIEDSKGEGGQASAFVTTLIAFFLAEMGDKTQIATVALAAAYSNLLAVVAGTACGMILANAPVIFIGSAFSGRLPLRLIRYVAAAVFVVLGILFLFRAMNHPAGG